MSGLLWDWLDCMSRENNFFACDSCEWSNTNYDECLCPLPWCPVSHFLFLSAVRDDLNWWEVVSVHPFGVVLWLYNGTSCMILLLFLHLDRVWLAEVGCHLTACLTSFVFPRPFDPRWIRVHPTSLQLSLFLFYILRHKVCSDCTGISGMVCGLCMDCWIAFLSLKSINCLTVGVM